eukprot:scaffold56571_cov36-Phaeocystis_antarctica.AAC.1
MGAGHLCTCSCTVVSAGSPRAKLRTGEITRYFCSRARVPWRRSSTRHYRGLCAAACSGGRPPALPGA